MSHLPSHGAGRGHKRLHIDLDRLDPHRIRPPNGIEEPPIRERWHGLKILRALRAALRSGVSVAELSEALHLDPQLIQGVSDEN